MRKKLWSILFLIGMLVFVIVAGRYSKDEESKKPAVQIPFAAENVTLRLRYTDEALTDYLGRAAAGYMAEHEGVTVRVEKADEISYLDDIYEDSVNGQSNMPDLYITTTDTLEKAYLSGTAAVVSGQDSQLNEQNFPITALDSVRYKGKLCGYPMYYDTALFVYNRTYLKAMADSHNEALSDAAEAQAAMEKTEEMLSEGADPDQLPDDEEAGQELVAVEADDLIPADFEDILELAESYDAPEGMESILKWDVTDIFYNYFFIGDHISVGGECGDDPSDIDICNDDAVACMEVYQALQSFFSIDAKDADYQNIFNEFIEGKTLFTIISASSLGELEKAASDGRLNFEYGVSLLPALTKNLSSRPLAVTNAVVVNGFSDQQEQANDLARFLSVDADRSLWDMTGYPAACLNAEYDSDNPGFSMAAYSQCAHLPKLMSASDFWMQLEITMTGIWEGNDTMSAMQELEDKVKAQVAKN